MKLQGAPPLFRFFFAKEGGDFDSLTRVGQSSLRSISHQTGSKMSSRSPGNDVTLVYQSPLRHSRSPYFAGMIAACRRSAFCGEPPAAIT